ncbi:MAG: hypothetical protein EP318_04370 [Rhodobacteraceae bacterium]|nr:MAG: hypothetical protein EP318_04370 [Paracoccaceae bacterium]
MTRDDLATLRRALSGCEMLQLVDVAARTVLIAESAVKLGQEHHEALCAQAAAIFAPDRRDAPGCAMLAGPTGTRVFVASQVDPGEVLCGLFAPGAALSSVEASARALFARPADAGA